MLEQSFLNTLRERVILFDGGMGTELYNRGIYVNRCFDETNLSNPKLVREVHEDFIRAGAEVIETNTFGANAFKLKPHGLHEQCRELNYKGARLARDVAGDQVYVAGSIGPLGVKIEPWGPTSVEEARDAFKEQAQGLADGDVDLFILETFSDLAEIQQALKAVKDVAPHLPVICSMAINDDGKSLYGTSPELFTRRLEAWGADIIGVNCQVGPARMLTAVEKMVATTDRPVSVMPEAGAPVAVENRNIFLGTEEYLSEYTRRFIQAGARVVGGCCGVRPMHIKAMRSAIRSLVPGIPAEVAVHEVHSDVHPLPEGVVPVPRTDKSAFAKALVEGRFATTVEITPPRGCDPTKTLEKAQRIKDAGVHVINIPDGPRAAARMGALSLASLIETRVGIETCLHYTCRDRNLLGMISDLMGAYALGLRNILLVTGDPPKMGTYPDATAVFDVDAIGLTNMVNHLNQGLDIGGNPIGKPTGWHIGVGLNPGAIDLDHELRRFDWKVKAGAEYAITQPVFDVNILKHCLERLGDPLPVPIIAGVWPLISLRNAEFMNNEVPGASVPDPILARMAAAQARGKEAAKAEGIEIAKESLREIRPLVQGAQVSAPLGRAKTALEVLAALE